MCGCGNLLNLSYQYDPLGNISQITDNLMADSQTFTYDHLNRLITANGGSDFGCTLPCYGHSYNKLGNITPAMPAKIHGNMTGRADSTGSIVQTAVI